MSALGYQDLQTAVAAVGQRKFQLYWLGPSFDVDGARFFAGYGLGGENNPAMMNLQYAPGGPGSGLQLTEFPRAVLPTVEPQLPGTNPGRSQMNTTVGSHPAVLYRIPLGGRPNLLTVKVDLGDTIVVADTSVDASHRDATPNPNPLVDEARLLEVLSHLRPYPQ